MCSFIPHHGSKILIDLFKFISYVVGVLKAYVNAVFMFSCSVHVRILRSKGDLVFYERMGELVQVFF